MDSKSDHLRSREGGDGSLDYPTPDTQYHQKARNSKPSTNPGHIRHANQALTVIVFSATVVVIPASVCVVVTVTVTAFGFTGTMVIPGMPLELVLDAGAPWLEACVTISGRPVGLPGWPYDCCVFDEPEVAADAALSAPLLLVVPVLLVAVAVVPGSG